ncbi:hypothetical protein [Flavobacterium rhizosphaerae]|uniref:Anti-sigma factor n=1 Tax=Flavobacterium rhizosphaerae TaxID=3163298 RepID=A0ABW8YYU0_9FLAO
MELRETEKLLERYFNAETTITEEKQLKQYFTSPGVAPHLEQYRPMFGYFEHASQLKFEKTVPLKTKKPKAVWLSVAASVVMLLGIVTWFNYQDNSNELGTYDDPEVAFRETQKALNMLSQNVNVGVASMTYIEKYEKSKEKIFKE